VKGGFVLGTIADRINQVITTMGIKKTEFARRLKISDSSVSTMCSGKSKPSGQTITMICYEFGIDENWLRTGAGEMYAPKAENELERLVLSRGQSRRAYIAIEKLLSLKPEVMEGVIDYCLAVADTLRHEEKSKNVSSKIAAEIVKADAKEENPQHMTDEELHAELDRQLALEKKQVLLASGPGCFDTATG